MVLSETRWIQCHVCNNKTRLQSQLTGNCTVIPDSNNLDHIQENTELHDFELTDEEMEKINIMYCLNKKLDAISMRMLYTDYKTAPTEEERKGKEEVFRRTWSA